MSGGTEQLISAEYSSLRDELLRDKQYIFERPLLIITAAGIASVQLSGQPSVVFLPLLLAILLLSNLWFTVNRLRSGARIAAYIAVVLEPGSCAKWIGWENSLRLYRIWTKVKNAEEQRNETEKYMNRQAIPDAMMFYPPLWLLHLVMALVALGTSASSVGRGCGTLAWVAFVLTLIATGTTAWFCAWQYHPRNIRGLIEAKRAIWQAVFLTQDELERCC